MELLQSGEAIKVVMRRSERSRDQGNRGPRKTALTAPSPVDLHSAQAADCVGQVDSVGEAEVVEGQHALLDFGPGFEQMAAVNSGQQTALDGRREPAAVFLGKHITDSAFSDFATQIEKKRVVESVASGLFKCTA